MKRGASGLSLIVGVNKPATMSSHDVVNRCRRIFGERRVGHTGTLDPLASGVLPICVGPATRLDAYLTGHDKRYRVRIAFGASTTTDDAAGEIVETAPVPAHLFDDVFAREAVAALIGAHDQVPPAYSAIKVDGKRAYQMARAGGDVHIEPRRIRVHDAAFLEMEELGGGLLAWDVDFHVSKGTYIRSLARDLGAALGCPAHVAALERTAAGLITLDDCVNLESLETLKSQVALDPVRVLGLRFAFLDDYERFVNTGNILYANQVSLYEPLPLQRDESVCACTSSVVPSARMPRDGELICAVIGNRLKALYSFAQDRNVWKPDCVFSTPVFRA